MGKKIDPKEISRIRNLAKSHTLKDVAKLTGFAKQTVEKHAKGIRPRMNRRHISKQNSPPCPACGSTHVWSNGKEEWKCGDCKARWAKRTKTRQIKIRKKEHDEFIELKQRGLSYSKIAGKLGRDRSSVIRHVTGKILPRK